MGSAPQLHASTMPDNRAVHLTREDGTPLLTHRIAVGQRPSIHPLHAPGGRGVLTEDSPSHHPWQHGLYTGFNMVNGIGFWREQPGDGAFDPRLVAEPRVTANAASWALETRWIAPDGSPLISERQDWTLTDEGETVDLDLNWALRAVVDVEIGQFMAGGLFLRMPWRPDTGGVVINSEGQRNSETERQRARWVAVSMPIPGQSDWGAVAIMDHPGNPGHPVTWRVDNELGVSPSRCIAESWTIPAGSTERYHFRLHIFSGDIDTERIDHRWREFAAYPGPVS